MNRQERRASLASARARRSWEWVNRLPENRHHMPRYPELGNMRAAYVNDFYSVQLYEVTTSIGEVTQLVIRDHRGKPVESWADLQRIKNELVGESRTAVQVFPSTVDLVDSANLYHLWVLPEGYRLPFGLHFDGGSGFR